jgi:hypothetical protein
LDWYSGVKRIVAEQCLVDFVVVQLLQQGFDCMGERSGHILYWEGEVNNTALLTKFPPWKDYDLKKMVNCRNGVWG